MKLTKLLLLFISSRAIAKIPINYKNLKPEEVVKNFYTWYFKCAEKHGQRNCLKTTTANQFVTHFLRNSIINDQQLDYDYFIGGNSMDEAKSIIPTLKFKTKNITYKNSKVDLVFTQFRDQPDSINHINLKKENGLWKINKVRSSNDPNPKVPNY